MIMNKNGVEYFRKELYSLIDSRDECRDMMARMFRNTAESTNDLKSHDRLDRIFSRYNKKLEATNKQLDSILVMLLDEMENLI